MSVQPPDAADKNQKPRIGARFNPSLLRTPEFPGSFIPEQLCRYRGLSWGAKGVWGRLRRYAGKDGNAFPSVRGLARECGLGETQTRRHLHELQRKRFLEVDCEHLHYTGSGGGTYGYFFVWHACFEGDVGIPRRGSSQPVQQTADGHRRVLEALRHYGQTKGRPPLRQTASPPLRSSASPPLAEERTRRESSQRLSRNESQSVSPSSVVNSRTDRPTSRDEEKIKNLRTFLLQRLGQNIRGSPGQSCLEDTLRNLKSTTFEELGKEIDAREWKSSDSYGLIPNLAMDAAEKAAVVAAAPAVKTEAACDPLELEYRAQQRRAMELKQKMERENSNARRKAAGIV